MPEDDRLINQNPRDSLVLRRQNNLAALKELRRKEKIGHAVSNARGNYEYYLKDFAKEYLAENNEQVFVSLSPLEKDALSKICASSCRFRLVRHLSICTAVFGAPTILGASHHHPAWFVITVVMALLYTFLGLYDIPVGYIRFLKSRRILMKNNKEI